MTETTTWTDDSASSEHADFVTGASTTLPSDETVRVYVWRARKTPSGYPIRVDARYVIEVLWGAMLVACEAVDEYRSRYDAIKEEIATDGLDSVRQWDGAENSYAGI